MHITTRSTLFFLSSIFALGALSACYPSDPHELGHSLVVHGVVTDSGTGQPLPGVKVTLLSIDDFPSQTTDAQGYFQFSDVLEEQNLLVQFQLQGYLTVTLPVNPTLIEDGGTSDGGVGSFPGFGSDVDGFDASVALSQVLAIAVAGTVYSEAVPAAGAQVMLTTADGTPVYQATAGSDGSFAFPSVRANDYELVVLPWDRDGDGLTDTQFFEEDLDVEAGSATDFGHLAIELADVQKALVASSFASLNYPYPITAATLLGGVSGVLQATGGTLFLTFGAEVDPTVTSFELVQYENGGTRFSPPIGLTVAWTHGVTAQLTPAAALQASDASNIGYQLRITALRFADGTVAIPASSTTYGMLDFSVQSLPQPLANPQPSVYLANQFTATQAATSAVFDADTVWLLDANGDFVFDTVPADNWSAGNPMQLQWPSVPGAVAYHLFMRNTTSPGNSAAGTLDWVEQTAGLTIEATDPNQSQTIVATGVSPWATLTLGSADGPWAFGNHVQFAVTAQDALGFAAPIDTNVLLDTGDTFGGLLTNAAFDPASVAPFAVTTELGDTVVKALRLTFSEAMLTSSVPTVTSLGPRISVRKVLASGWSNNGTPTTGLDSATESFLSLQLANLGTCTEVTLARSVGDDLVAVRDASYFTVGAASQLVFLSPAGQFLAESDGIGAVDTTANLVTLAAPLTAGLAQSSYACALQGPAVTSVPSATGTTLAVTSAAPFAVGDSVLYYEPQGAGAPVADFLHVTGVDTSANLVVVGTAPSAGHTAASLLLPLPPFGSELTLRNSQTLALLHDVPGGPGAQLAFAGPISGIAVGDKLLVDADGDLQTTVDQAQVTVTQVGFAPTGTPAVYQLTADLPASITLLHGRAKVIALGDAFSVTGTKDTSGNGPLDPHRDQLTPDGVLY